MTAKEIQTYMPLFFFPSSECESTSPNSVLRSAVDV